MADCNIFGPNAHSSDECDANARLIAAAPDLLEACKTAVSMFPHFDSCNCLTVEIKQQMLDAILKAGGKP